MTAARAQALILAALLAACTVGPDFTPPQPATPSQWGDASARPGGQADAGSEPDPHWWRNLHDPTLDSLEQRAAAGNLDVQRTVFRILEVRAQVQVARAAGLPSLGGRGSYTREQLGLKGALKEQHVDDLVSGSPAGQQALGALAAPLDLFQAGFDASWELDLFGRVRRSVEQAEAQEDAALASRADALVSLEAEVAQTYAQLRGAQELTRITAEEITTEQDVLTLTRQRHLRGLVSELDVDQAATQLNAVQAQLPQFEQQADQAMANLAVLLGQPPEALRAELITAGPVPLVPAIIPIGLPATLARRRPDIRQAEAQLHAATAGLGVAVAQLFPDISLTGSLGTRATQAKYLGDWANHFSTGGGTITLPLFEGGRLTGGVRLARAEEGDAVLAYRQTVLTALRDVENALTALRTEQARQHRLGELVASARDLLYLARNRYDHGLSSFIDVLNSETTLVQARQQWTQSAMITATNLVALYKALGGGWEEASPVPDQSAPHPQ